MNVHLPSTKRVLFSGETIIRDGIPDSFGVTKTASSKPSKYSKYHSQPLVTGPAFKEAITDGQFAYHPSIKRMRDNRFDSFKTWSGRLERQLTQLRGKLPREAGPKDDTVHKTEFERNLPVDRYFDALEGPELDTVKVCVFFPPPLCAFYFLFDSLSIFWVQPHLGIYTIHKVRPSNNYIDFLINMRFAS